MYNEMTQPHSTPLANPEILQLAPSVFAAAPRGDVSDKYGFIPTIQVIDELREHGWMPVSSSQKNVRIKDNEEFTKHLVRFRRLGDDIVVGDSVVELVLTNSHDRTSGFVLHAGIFRMACANGIVIADSTFSKVNVRHSKFSAGKVVDGSYRVIDEVPKIAAEVETMQNIDLTPFQRNLLAQTALDYMRPEVKEVEGAPRIITEDSELVRQMLQPKRAADTGTDLWSTYNVIQEKALRGGLTTTKLSNGRYRRNTTREVKSIDKNIKLNKALWSMAEQMKNLKLEEAA